MAEQSGSPADIIQRGARRPARLIRIICQLILGAGLAIGLILKVYMMILTDHVCAPDGASVGNLIRCTPTLTMLACFLALSAGFDLAQRLFEDNAERVLPPVMLGLGAAILGVLSNLDGGAAGWREALLIVSLIASISAIAWVSRMLTKDGGD